MSAEAKETDTRHLTMLIAAAAPVLSTGPAQADLGDQLFKLLPNDGDGVVNRHDILEVVHNLGLCDDPDNCPWDVNGDGIVNGRDVAAVATHFGPCP